ncbi:MAG: ABC transporter permease [Oscillospiraceae bacterium]|nr:ABC transporter permease [Oscillospiraceae bacterium]
MKFGSLLKKELRELFTKQMVITMAVTMGILIGMGQLMGTAMDDIIQSSSTINVCNRDDSEFTNTLLSGITASGSVRINYIDIQGDDYASELMRLDVNNAVIIPAGYADSILEEKEPAQLIFISRLNLGGGFMASMEGISASDVISHIEMASTDEILLQTYGVDPEDIARIKSPAALTEFTVSGSKTARVSPAALTGIMMTQALIAPMVVFFLLIMAAQMIMTAVSTEKIDKTLETLMSTPASRMAILSAKMLAAVLAALANAAFMMVGFAFYLGGMTGNAMEQITGATAASLESAEQIQLSVGQAMLDLGLTLSPLSYALFGLQLFLTLAIGLSIALILGAMATDVKSVQTLLMPIMIAVMLPWLVTMFMDISSMSFIFKTLVYLIPFTHAYIALPNLMEGNTVMFFAGLLYQTIFLLICMYLAVKMFTTDKLFTMSLNLDAGRKRRLFSLKLFK